MGSMEAEKEGARTERGARAFAVPREGSDVVADRMESAFTDVDGGSEHVEVSHKAGQFQVGIGERARWVVVREHGGLDVGGETRAPEDGRGVWGEPDATHAGFGGIDTAESERWRGGDEFGPASRSRAKGRDDPAEVVEGSMGVRAEAKASVGRKGGVGRKERLEVGEEASSARKTRREAAEFAEELPPLSQGDSGLTGGNGLEAGLEFLEAMGGELKGAVGGIDEPTEYCFALGPVGITFGEFFDGGGFFAGGAIRGRQRTEDLVD